MRPYFLLLLATILAFSSAVRHCKDNTDCETDECCYQWNDFLNNDLRCKKLGKEGDPCHRRETVLPKYRYYCNCGPGLRCKQTFIDEGQNKIAVYRCAKA